MHTHSGNPLGPRVPTASTGVLLDLSSKARRKVFVGAVGAGVLGLVVMLLAIFGVIGAGGVLRVTTGALGAGFLGLSLIAVMCWRVISRDRRLRISPHGLRWDEDHGSPFTLRWAELGAVELTRGERGKISLDLYPGDSNFRQRHPEMEHLYGRHGIDNGYRLPLGDSVQLLPPVELALRRYCLNLYRGVR
ncbi:MULTISPECIES: hypothetical protein [unclassified Crossiella]|uniref:hypothetical protein n=1 Tax=unclassified Crossiella TaxID=2620835 RepID=UPI002000013D|nr:MULTISPECIES: hypothetical protein [unclassified Crossiella]MCK2244867.1 hypothetical protein [Crossiella sp. S99.2]MCK2258580.1 hypothetical protein [Crossiella sp. S99.1]